MYRVERFFNSEAMELQRELTHWIESKKHIDIISINIWSHEKYNYALIVYREQ